MTSRNDPLLRKLTAFTLSLHIRGRHVLLLPSLGVIAFGATAEAARARLEEKCAEIIARARADGTADALLPSRMRALSWRRRRQLSAASGAVIPESRAVGPAAAPLSLGQDLLRFTLKFAIVLVVLGIGVGVAVKQIKASVKTGRSFWNQVQSDLIKAAEPGNEMPAEQREALAKAIRVLAERYRPLVGEVSAAFPNASCPPASPAPSRR